MTDMRRLSVSFPDDLAQEIDKYKQDPRFAGKPYSVLIRYFVELGFRAYENDQQPGDAPRT